MVMKFLRKKRNMKIILWTVAIFIIPGFLIWGVGLGSSNKSAYYAAVVNKEPILLKDYYKKYNEMESEYRRIFGDLSEGILKNFNLEKITLDNMIREKLLFQQAKKRRIKVLNTEIIEAIKSFPDFKDESGKFDEKKYKEIVSAIPSEELRKIEDGIRDQMTLDKLRNLVMNESDVNVTDKDVDEYIKNNQISDVDRESVRKNLLRQKQEESFSKWYEDLKERSKIKIYLSVEKPEATTERDSGN